MPRARRTWATCARSMPSGALQVIPALLPDFSPISLARTWRAHHRQARSRAVYRQMRELESFELGCCQMMIKWQSSLSTSRSCSDSLFGGLAKTLTRQGFGNSVVILFILIREVFQCHVLILILPYNNLREVAIPVIERGKDSF